MPLTPLSRRLVGLAGLLSLLLIAVVFNYLMHEGGAVLNPVAQAAEKTARQPGAHLAFEITFRGEGQPVVGTGDGNYDAGTDRTDAQMQVAVPGSPSTWVETVSDARTDYSRSEDLETVLPPGKLWLEMQPLLGHSSQTALGSQTEAGGTMKVLETLGGGVDEVGHTIVRGHQTTHYKTTLRMSRAARILRERGEAELAHEYEAIAAREPDPIPVEVWVDERGLVRMFRMVEQLPTTSGAKPVMMDMRMEFFRFGKQPPIPLPAKGTVLDYTPVLRAELGMIDGSKIGTLDPPAGAKPLTTESFHRLATATCHRMIDDARTTFARSPALMKEIERAAAAKDATRIRGAATAWGEEVGETTYRGLRRRTLDLARLAPPTNLAKDYRRYLGSMAEAEERLLAESRALEVGNFESPVLHHKAGTREAEREREQLVSKLGIPACQKGAGPVNPSALLE